MKYPFRFRLRRLTSSCLSLVENSIEAGPCRLLGPIVLPLLKGLHRFAQFYTLQIPIVRVLLFLLLFLGLTSFVNPGFAISAILHSLILFVVLASKFFLEGSAETRESIQSGLSEIPVRFYGLGIGLSMFLIGIFWENLPGLFSYCIQIMVTSQLP